MKKVWLGILATLLLALFVAPAFAWDFSMTGEFEWRQQYFSRIGQNDIFGNASLQDNAILNPGLIPATVTPALPNIGFAGPNIYRNGWAGSAGLPTGDPTALANGPIMRDNAGSSFVRITRGGYSTWGCDAYNGDQRLTFNPSIRVNNAIRIHGVYTVGGYAQKFVQAQTDGQGQFSPGTPPFERYYRHHSSDAAYNTAAIGSWEQVRATIQLPIATFSIGIKDFPFGTGMTFSNADRTDSFLAVVPYGPFRFLFAVWPGQGGKLLQTSYETKPDRDTKFDYRYGPLVTYENGPLWLGFGGILGYNHLHRRTASGALPGAFLGFNGAAAGPTASSDTWDWLWAASMKYNNGRFFFNAEGTTRTVDTNWIYNSTSGPNANAAGAIGLAGPRYQEFNKYMAEGGVLFGPAKVTLMYAWSSGQSLPGVNVNAANSGFNPTKQFAIFPVNYQVLQPYSFLMFPTYGGGNNMFHPDGTGQMGDAYCLAGRFDYAAAANLNVFGSYIWAHRVEKNGYYAGAFNSTNNGAFNTAAATISTTYPVTAATAASPTQAQALKAANGWGANANPFVDDGYLGWEAQAGVDWKLLEGLSMQVAYSYWHLGDWFDQAYQAFTLNRLNGDGLYAGRDPIQALRGSFTINF